MNGYIDTSVLAACYIKEASSAACEKHLAMLDDIVISSLVEVEFYSVIARKIRMKDISLQTGREAVDLFEMHINEGFFMRIQFEKSHQQLAKRWLGRFDTQLRTLDALHLAIAHENNLVLITADKPLAACAKQLKTAFKLIQ